MEGFTKFNIPVLYIHYDNFIIQEVSTDLEELQAAGDVNIIHAIHK